MGIVPPPGGGLTGFANYNLYDNCENLTGVWVTVNVTEEMIAKPSFTSSDGIQSNGIGFQLNCLPSRGGGIKWQQYIMVLSRTGQDLRWGVNNWNYDSADSNGVIYQGGHLATLPSSFGAGYANIPAGYRFQISLNSDFLGNITGVTFSMYDQNGAAVFPPQPIPLTTLTDVNGNQVTAADLSPIVDIQVVVGGYANGTYTSLVRGAGTVTYHANNPLTVLNNFPQCSTSVGTAESSNVRWGQLDSTASINIVQTFQVGGGQVPPLPTGFQTVDNYQNIFVLGTDGNLWIEQGPFNSPPPPPRTQVDSNVFTFQALDDQTVFVLGRDGNLRLAQGKFGKVPPPRVQVDSSVQSMQALSSSEVLVLGNDGKLWLEQGSFGKVPPPRVQVDSNVNGFHAVNDMNIFVLDVNGNLWLEQGPFKTGPTSRQQVDANVRTFSALGVYAFVWVLGNDGNLWLEFAQFGTVPPNRILIDTNVLAMQPLDLNDVIVLRTDGTLWLEQGSSASTPVTRTQIDGNVIEFAATDTSNVLVLGADGNLWLEQAPFGTVPPARHLVDTDAA